MFRNVLNRILSSRLFYIVFSILVAITLWVLVEINENQEQSIRIDDIPVIIIGADIIRDDRGLFVLPTWGPQTISLEIDCSRSIATRLQRGDIEARIDVSRITTTGGTSIAHEIILPDGVDESYINRIAPSVDRISLTIERLTEKPIRVDVLYTGGAASDFITDEPMYDPHTVRVFGPADVLSRIGHARVEVLRENLNATYIEELEFILIDSEGEELDEELYEQLSFSHETIHVTIPVRQTKEIRLEVEFIYGMGASRENVAYYIEPEFVTVVGEPDVLRGINSISLGQIDLRRSEFLFATEMRPIEFPNDVENESGILQASVTFEMSGLEFEIFPVPVSNIHVVNEPPDHEVRIVTQSIDVRVRASRTELNRLKAQIEAGFLPIRIVADLSQAGTGQTRLTPNFVSVNIDGFDNDLIGAVGNYRVTVNITEDVD